MSELAAKLIVLAIFFVPVTVVFVIWSLAELRWVKQKQREVDGIIRESERIVRTHGEGHKLENLSSREPVKRSDDDR